MKNNELKRYFKFLAIVGSVLLMVVLSITLPLCLKQINNDPAEVEPIEAESTFVQVEQELLGVYNYKIVYHKDTKVMYVVGHYSDFTVMLNADGTPMIWEGE